MANGKIGDSAKVGTAEVTTVAIGKIGVTVNAAVAFATPTELLHGISTGAAPVTAVTSQVVVALATADVNGNIGRTERVNVSVAEATDVAIGNIGDNANVPDATAAEVFKSPGLLFHTAAVGVALVATVANGSIGLTVNVNVGTAVVATVKPVITGASAIVGTADVATVATGKIGLTTSLVNVGAEIVATVANGKIGLTVNVSVGAALATAVPQGIVIGKGVATVAVGAATVATVANGNIGLTERVKVGAALAAGVFNAPGPALNTIAVGAAEALTVAGTISAATTDETTGQSTSRPNA